jgi:hypothetical protein
MVQDPEGGVILIGGYSGPGHLGILYHLSDSGSTWRVMKQFLKIARSYHSAILIPDELTNCYKGKRKKCSQKLFRI